MNITPSMPGFRADMIGEHKTPFVVHVEVRVSVTSRADDGLKLAPAAVAQPAAEQLAFGGILGLALVCVSFPAKLLDPFANRVVVTVGDRFPHTSDVRHKTPLVSGDDIRRVVD